MSSSLLGNTFVKYISFCFAGDKYLRWYEIEIKQEDLDFLLSEDDNGKEERLKEIFDSHLIPRFEVPLPCFDFHRHNLLHATVFNDTEDETFACRTIVEYDNREWRAA